MGSGSSMKLNSKSQEFSQTPSVTRNDSQIIVSSKNFKTKKHDRYSYCPSENHQNHNFNYQQHLNYYNNFSSINKYKQQQHQQQYQYDNNKYYTNNNIYYKFPDVNASNAKNFENFIVPSQLMLQQSKINHINDLNNDQSKIAMTKSLVMYDVDFEKFNRSSEINNNNNHNNHKQQGHTNTFNSRQQIKQPLTTSSSIYQDLIDLDKDLEKRENDLKLQTNKFPLKSIIVVNNINRNSSTSSSSTSSGCSSDSASNNTARKKSNSSKADTSLHSVNTYMSDINTNNNTNSINTQKDSPCLLTSVSTTLSSSSNSATSCFNKSILSTSANLSSSCSSISSPTDFFSIKSEDKSKRAENRRNNISNGKTKSEYLFNRSDKNGESEKAAGFYKKNFSTISHNLSEQQQQKPQPMQNELIKNRSKEKSNKIKAKGRDSGIISDLFHLNSSMTNIKTKLSNAKHNLRNSLSAFNLKNLSVGKKSKNNLNNIKKIEENSIKSTSLTANMSYTAASSFSSSSSLSLNKLKPRLINSDTSDDYEEINSNENNSIHNNINNNISVAGVNEEIDLRKNFNSKENISSFDNKMTKSKQSSINNFMLSNLSTNASSSSTNNNNNIKNTYDYNSYYNIIKKTDENYFISSNNLTLNNNNKTSDIHPFINCKQTIINNNYKEHQLNYECSNNNNNSNIHNLSFSSSNLIASNSNNDENKIARFTNSFKSNESKQILQNTTTNNNNSSIKRTMTFHSTNSKTNSVENNLNKSILINKSNDIQGSGFTTIINCNNNNESKIKTINNNSNVSSYSSSNNNNNNKNISNTSNLNSNKLVNSKTISSFKPNTIPIISNDQNRSKEMSHSVSMGHQQNKSSSSSSGNEQKQGLATHRHQKIVVQASTSDLLNCFSIFISEKCAHLVKETYVNPLTFLNNDIGKRIKFEPRDTINWLRSADRALLIQGWQEIAFMNPVNVVFVYLLVRDTLKEIEVKSVYELQCNIMACLYLAFSYMGNEISYPLKPFLIEENREIFWQRIVDLMNRLSSCMLRINRDPRYFTELFYELKSFSNIKRNENLTGIGSVSNTAMNTLNININKACFKQFADQSNNSIEIKIDNNMVSNKNKTENGVKGVEDTNNSNNNNNKISKIIQEKQISLNSFKPINIANEQPPTRVRSGLYISNENQNPLNSFCI